MSAAQTRYTQALAARTRQMLASHPAAQAEAIARHYTSLAMLALSLRKLLQECRCGDCSPAAQQTIQHIVAQVKEQHRLDFGLELDWPQQPEEQV